MPPTQYLEMLKRSHVDERGFDKVDLDLATAVTLVLLLHIEGVVATRDLRLLWTCDAVALDKSWRARSGRVTLALQEVRARPAGISCLSWRSVRSCVHLLEETWRQFQSAPPVLSECLAPAPVRVGQQC